MSSNKNVVKKSKPSLSSTSNGSVRRLEKEKSTDLRKVKKEEASVNAKNTKQSNKNIVTNDVDAKAEIKSVASNNPAKRSNSKISTSSSSTKSKSMSVDTPSKRVVKSQYFPSKNMISNAVKGKARSTGSEKIETQTTTKPKETPKGRSREASQTRKLKTKAENSSDRSSERPRTATLRKGSIVNSNIVGPDAPKPSSKRSDSNSYDYEDDFDSYESDFEEYKTSSSSSSITDIQSVESYATSTSTSDADMTSPQKTIIPDEERKLDSGNFDLNNDSKHKQLLDKIKEAVEQENAALSNLTSLSDEGFEEGKSMNGNNNFINFLDAQKKCIRRKSLAQRKKRGEELLNMIKLDHQNFTLLDIPAVTYDEYIRIYGNKSGHQASSQTGDDNVDETTQTDAENAVSKWTQFPIVIPKRDAFDKDVYAMELSGCGTDTIAAKERALNGDNVNLVHLSRFLTSVEDVVTQLLQKNCKEDTNSLQETKLPFSDGYIPIRANDISILKQKSIKHVTFSDVDETKFLTVHNSTNSEETESVICVWNVINPIQPEKVLITHGQVSGSCFGLDNSRVIFGAFIEGTIAIWSLEECIDLKSRIDELTVTKPNFMTGINYGHVAKIVSIQSLVDDGKDGALKSVGFDLKPASQICSLDETGVLIIWSVIVKINDRSMTKNISLIQNSKISLSDVYSNLKDFQCTDMTINVLDLNHLFVSTNYGYILHHLVNGTKPMPKKYVTDEISPSNCLATCPFSPVYFLSGQDNGKIILFSRSTEKELKELTTTTETNAKLKLLQWSYNKPFVFYSADNNNLHVWDLANSDLYPTYSLKFNQSINLMRLSPNRNLQNANKRSYMIIVTENCKIDLHILNKEHGPQKQETYQNDVKRFLNYINRF